MATLLDNFTPDDNAHVVGSRLERIDPDNFTNQSGRSDGPVALEDDNDAKTEDGDPAGTPDHGEHNHH